MEKLKLAYNTLTFKIANCKIHKRIKYSNYKDWIVSNILDKLEDIIKIKQIANACKIIIVIFELQMQTS